MYVRLTPTTRGKFGTQIRLYLASTVFSPSFTSHLLQQKSHLQSYFATGRVWWPMRRRRARDLSPAPSPPVSALSLAPLLSGSGRRRRLPCSLYQRAGGEVEGAWQRTLILSPSRSAPELLLPSRRGVVQPCGLHTRAPTPAQQLLHGRFKPYVTGRHGSASDRAPPLSIQAPSAPIQLRMRQFDSIGTDSSSIGADSSFTVVDSTRSRGSLRPWHLGGSGGATCAGGRRDHRLLTRPRVLPASPVSVNASGLLCLLLAPPPPPLPHGGRPPPGEHVASSFSPVQSALSPRANAFEEKGDAVLHPLPPL